MKQKISKTQLIDEVYNSIPGIQLKQVDVVVNSFLDKVSQALSQGNFVEMRGFGSFDVLPSAVRQTGVGDDSLEKKKSYRVKFKPGKKIKENIQKINMDIKNEVK